MTDTLIKVKDLCRSFKLESGTQEILKHIDLDFYKGDFTVIMGSSGSGKSTLLYAISGMDFVNSGNIYYGDIDITKLSSDEMAKFRRDHCGFIFQQICLVDSMTVLNNVLAVGLLKKSDKNLLVQKAKDLLNEVEVEEHTWPKYPSQISGGKAQRVGIVRALINSPDVLFADEPTGALNSKTSEEVLNLFIKFNEQGQSIILVTHDVKTALRGNRILYLRDGQILDECNLGKYEEGNEERKQKLNKFLCEMNW